MALDGIFIHSILQELKSKLLGGKVEKVNQPEKDEIILTIRNEKTLYKLLISSSSIYPKIHITDKNKKNPLQPPMFCMILRKYLNSSKLINISQLDTDRVIFLDFQSLNELGFDNIYTLVIEIMGKHSNITLIRKKDTIIMDSIKHITPEINSIRSLFPGIKYIFPPISNKLNPFCYKREEFKHVLQNMKFLDNKSFSKIFTGVSTSFSKELYHMLSELKLSELDIFKESTITVLHGFCSKIFSKFKNNEFYFAYYTKDGKMKDFYCSKLTYLKDCVEVHYSTPSKLIDDFYYEKDKADRLNSKSSDMQKLININLERCNKKIKILMENLKDCKNKDTYRIQGELLTSNIYNIHKGDSKIKVQNYYSNILEYITIKLDINKTPSENIQSYFKKYNKLKKTEKAAEEQLKIAKEEIEYLNSVLINIKNSDSYDHIEEIKRELMETGYIKFKKSTNKKKTKAFKPAKFISSDGIEIYVGKNNLQNDYLTLKFADKRDLWFHTKNTAGSHVIVKNFGKVPDKTLEEAASLAAYYSKARNSSKVAVDYTEVRNMHKPNGAKPGMVIYYSNKTIYITPEKPSIEQID